MQSHGPKRVYTPKSLEFWFEKLSDEWESHFSAPQLEQGHRLYRDGDVRELELTETDAIVHHRVDKKDEYAVIEWEGEKLSVRSSSTDVDVARSLAVAGLHEIEELVADEISPLPAETAALPPESAAPVGMGSNTPAPSPDRMSRRPTPRSARGPSRKLVLVFKTRVTGLSFRAFWEGSGKKRELALGAAAHADGNGQVTSSERAKLIGLAAYARKAHFQFSNKSGVYLLKNVAEIPTFLKGTLTAWRRLFTIELDNNVTRLVTEPKQIHVEAVAGRKAPTDGLGGNDREAGALDLRWIFKAGEQLLTDQEVRSLLKRGKTPTILPSVGIVELPTEQIRAIESWRQNVEETHGETELSPYLVFSLFHDNRFKLTVSPELQAWRDEVVKPQALDVALPELLRPYQRRGVEWMHHLADVGCHGLLADEMGLGKTLQVISLLAVRPVTGKPHLVVCPASVVPVWREEIERYFPQLPTDILKTGNDFVQRADPVIWLASYTQLRKHRELLPQAEFGYVILDEGQFIKNPDAKVTQTTYAVRADHRIVLTGTPLENRQLDLWSIFRFLLPSLLGSRQSFETQLNADRVGTMTRLRAQLAPFILRRTKAEVATELPPKVEMDLDCPMTEVQRAEYARICREGLQRLGDDVGAAIREKSFGFLALLTRLRQVCCDPDMLPWRRSPLSDSGKIGLLVEKLGEVVESGHKVVIFSQFVMLLDRVKAALNQHHPDLNQFELTGMTLDRQKPVQEFQTCDDPAVMLVSLKAAGTGITLHAADYVFLLDPWWNPAVEAQAVDRVHRIGQTKTVFVYRMVTAGTIEERIQELKSSKRELFDKLVGGLGGDFDLGQHFSSLQDLVTLTQETTEADSDTTDVAENGG
jgi:superfamily II DNA or RNA helicase